MLVLISVVLVAPEFPLHSVVLWGFFAVQYFFATGHLYQFNKLHWGAGFIGFEEMNFAGGTTLVILETFTSPILFSFGLPILVSRLTRSAIKKPQATLEPFVKPFLTLMFFFAVNGTLTMIFVHSARRHLMVWKIFAPKYIFDMLFLMAIDALVLLVFTLVGYLFAKADQVRKK